MVTSTRRTRLGIVTLIASALIVPTATASGTPAAAAAPSAAAAAGFNGLTPARILDTRQGIGAPLAPLGQGASLDLVVAGAGGVPTTGVDAVVVNITVANPTADSYLTVWPAGAGRPESSSLNYTAGQTVPNLVIAKVGAGGAVSIFNAFGAVDVIADVTGWYATGSQVISLTPQRLLDTRTGLGGVSGPTAGIVSVAVAGRAGVPAVGASAVVANITAVGPAAAGYLTTWPSGAPRPDASTLNFVPGRNVPNLAIVRLGTDGAISYFTDSAVHVLIDVVGYVSGSGANQYNPLVPYRVLDTRDGGGGYPRPMDAGETTFVQVLGLGGVPTSGVGAVAVNLTIANADRAGYATVWPVGLSTPPTSNANFTPGTAVANAVIMPVGLNGKIAINVSGANADVIVDVVGWMPGSVAARSTMTQLRRPTCAEIRADSFINFFFGAIRGPFWDTPQFKAIWHVTDLEFDEFGGSEGVLTLDIYSWDPESWLMVVYVPSTTGIGDYLGSTYVITGRQVLGSRDYHVLGDDVVTFDTGWTALIDQTENTGRLVEVEYTFTGAGFVLDAGCSAYS
jgi:hypothetical protein